VCERIKISGLIGQGGLGYVRPYIVLQDLHIQSPIRMVVDTGASRTTISERDANRLGIEYSSLTCPDNNRVIGIGGACRYYLAGRAALVFRISESSWHTEMLDSVFVLKTETDNDEAKKAAQKIPSLLGIDILKKYSVRFTKKRVYIEK
jgi:predicted aspartyl protease